MNITELKANETFDYVIGRILSRNGPKLVKSGGRGNYVWEILLLDETGTVILTLWGASSGENYKLNSIVKISNGWCKVFRDTYQISLGKSGTIMAVPDDSTIPKTLG